MSSRTILHPSFLPLSARHHGGAELHPIFPEEVFYIDPSMRCRKRIPNLLTRMRVFDFSKLNTPQPIMSSRMAPPNNPDPFRFGPHPTRDLGSLTWRGCSLDTHLQPPRAVIQLSQEEDQAITNLLTLHHQGATGSNCTEQTGSLLNPERSCCEAAPMSPGALQNPRGERGWSEELRWSESRDHDRSRFSCVTELGDEDGRACGPGSEVSRAKELTELEVDAVHVLLNLSNLK
ncbi:uncharacterized protein LOC105356412 [Oryzias latipes]|uniref:uncharacterized protein LOC105356412 n=1 Tax=Oryzias latipes TaxID=8090 RepID=UPI0005CBE139|nr:uncharacterized protein LOC105356412 [Oryzias latipes]